MTCSSSLAMQQYFIEPRSKIYVKRYAFLSFVRICKKQLLETGLDALKTASKKVVHKKGEFLGNKITGKIVKPKHVIDGSPRNFEEIIIPPEKTKKRKH